MPTLEPDGFERYNIIYLKQSGKGTMSFMTKTFMADNEQEIIRFFPEIVQVGEMPYTSDREVIVPQSNVAYIVMQRRGWS